VLIGYGVIEAATITTVEEQHAVEGGSGQAIRVS